MEYLEYLSAWNKLTDEQREILKEASSIKRFSRGDVLHNGSEDCAGLFIIVSGQLRAYTVSEDGREITMYRLFDRDICLFSASCIMRSIQFDIIIKAEKECEVVVICPEAYKSVMEKSAPLANYTNELMATRFSEVMWLVEQIMWKSFDSRLAEFLINEVNIEETKKLSITHEQIGNHLGNPREVVTRMLKYFQNEGLVKLSRGIVEIINENGLEDIIK